MKTTRTLALVFGLLSIITIVLISCQKSKVEDLPESSPESTEANVTYQTAVRLSNGSLLSGGVTITAPEQVDVDETFNITAAISCGKVSIERGYIVVNNTNVYKDLTCLTANLQWEEIVPFQCYTNDANWNGSLSEPGTYVFRTKHNANEGNCDGAVEGSCLFSGNQFCCFVIEAVDGCETSFTGEAKSCGADREAVYTFTSKDALDYFKIQGGLTNFTGEDAIVTWEGGSDIVVWQGTPGGSSNRTIRVEGKLAECETITITIKWNSTNSGGVITGSWSVKDVNGVELAPAVEGLTCGN
ncbi:MAG TPA: hypothetical protein VF144_00530 [Chitinophagaceae bacterium]